MSSGSGSDNVILPMEIYKRAEGLPLSASHRKYGLEGDVVDECREFSNGAH